MDLRASHFRVRLGVSGHWTEELWHICSLELASVDYDPNVFHGKSEVIGVMNSYGTKAGCIKRMRLQLYRRVTHRYAPDLHSVSVADHEAQGRLSSAAVHLHELRIAGSVCSNTDGDIQKKNIFYRFGH